MTVLKISSETEKMVFSISWNAFFFRLISKTYYTIEIDKYYEIAIEVKTKIWDLIKIDPNYKKRNRFHATTLKVEDNIIRGVEKL